jgi:hypothetical protein
MKTSTTARRERSKNSTLRKTGQQPPQHEQQNLLIQPPSNPVRLICVVEDIEERRGRVLGWCPVSAIACLLPRDGRTGRWEQAAVELPVAGLVMGLPALVA